ncbi:MAG TPA: hypothetical protein HPQ00_09560 [Magnetococcales bacterium]|nr:hypothetical protein [Magnetococcales bacterium]
MIMAPGQLLHGGAAVVLAGAARRKPRLSLRLPASLSLRMAARRLSAG